ncbi:phosphotransferase [Spiroplasma culicicola]|uniref:Aminoglycoside phosphotransferase domain-containing protein n=1 Tax=Spiroplasma culicicola AES-1 TaxID=1276246 RepID=W6A7D0_9MOLU|nr:phosphotransferase [Spiroplasma culicicola]AHI53053.1 hypothetical protein SCULI_v1c07120 [Spiroplasma culicicola AES-1]
MSESNTFELGQSGKKIIKKDGKLFKEFKNIKACTLYFQKRLNKLGFRYIPIHYGFSDGYQILEFIPGVDGEEQAICSNLKIKNIVNFLVDFQQVCLKEFGHILSHNDLNPLNVVFDDYDNINKVIDWDKLGLGHRYDDLVYILWLWTGIAMGLQTDEVIIQKICTALKVYNQYQPIDFDELNATFQRKILSHFQNIDRTNEQAAEVAAWFRESMIWWQKNFETVKNNI